MLFRSLSLLFQVINSLFFSYRQFPISSKIKVNLDKKLNYNDQGTNFKSSSTQKCLVRSHPTSWMKSPPHSPPTPCMSYPLPLCLLHARCSLPSLSTALGLPPSFSLVVLCVFFCFSVCWLLLILLFPRLNSFLLFSTLIINCNC